MPLSLKNDNILHLPFVIAYHSQNLQSAIHQHGFQHVEVQIPIPLCDFPLANIPIIDLEINKCEDNLNRVWQPGCQTTLRRPPVQLQQVGQARRQYDRSVDGSNQAQALTAHRCGKCIDPKILRHFFRNNSYEPFQYYGQVLFNLLIFGK